MDRVIIGLMEISLLFKIQITLYQTKPFIKILKSNHYWKDLP